MENTNGEMGGVESFAMTWSTSLGNFAVACDEQNENEMFDTVYIEDQLKKA